MARAVLRRLPRCPSVGYEEVSVSVALWGGTPGGAPQGVQKQATNLVERFFGILTLSCPSKVIVSVVKSLS